MHPGAKKHAANSEEENFFNMTKNMCLKLQKQKQILIVMMDGVEEWNKRHTDWRRGGKKNTVWGLGI